MTNEIGGLAALAVATVDRVVRPVEGMHRAVADRVFSLLGPSAAGVRVVHDTIAGRVHGSLRTTNRALGTVATVGAAVAVRGRDVRFLDRSDRGLASLAGLNAAFGDQLEAAGSDLAIPMQLFPEQPEPTIATGRVVVLVHGLGGSERSWVPKQPEQASYPEVLADALGATVVTVRYNTGRHVSDNGRDLAERLDAALGAWPVPVTSVGLVGHSMGGLVIRSACHQGVQAGMAWPDQVRHAVYLGTPHRGAPLEQVARLGLGALAKLGETRPLAELGAGRSAGIKDLCHGYLIEDDWRDLDPDSFDDNRHLLPLLPGATHCFLAATVSARPGRSGPIGDLLVPYRSAAPAGLVDLPEPGVTTRFRHLGSTRHLELLRHPEVATQLVDWLTTP